MPEALDLMAIALSFVLAVVLTASVRSLARRWGMVARPRADRWHKQPTALLGGVAIFLTVAAVYLLLLPHTPQLLLFMGASAFLWLIGLMDDLLHLKPYQKLIGQMMGAALVVYADLSLPWTAWPTLNLAITVFWLVGITNAVNLLDNMDGLAAGIVAIASVFLMIHFLVSGQADEALLLAVFTATLAGFLIFNSHPASIFMGDCGSMFIGFFLAGTALLNNSGGRTTSLLPVLAVPVLTLFIPIFDTTLVTIMRKLSGRAVSQGGRDHTSHRLVALGLSERRAVILLYGLATLSGIVALLVRNLPLDVSVAVIVGFTLLLTLLGVYLAGIKVYTEQELQAAKQKPLVTFLINLSYKRRLFEVMLDVVLIVLSYYLAYALVFGSISEASAWQQFTAVVPILIFIKMGVFLVMGVYRGVWRYVSVDNLIVHGKAVVVGSALSVLTLLFAFRFEGLSRAVFVLDGLLLLVFLGGSRILFRVLRNLLPMPGVRTGRRVLIYGAGDAGELLVRELRNNPSLQCLPVGLVDDDPLKKGTVIHGLRVLGGNGAFLSICRDYRIEEVIISSNRISDERAQDILADCRQANVTLKRLRLEIEDLNG